MRHAAKILISILLVLCFASLSFGQANIGFKGVGAKIGFVGPEGGVDNTIGFGGLVDLGNITDMIKLGAFVEYWKKSVGSGDASVDFSALAIEATGSYYFPMQGSSISPYVGAGLGFVRSEAGVNVDLGPFGSVSGSGSSTDLGISILGGIDMALSPKATGRAEFKYNIGGIDYWGIFVGAIFGLGK